MRARRKEDLLIISVIFFFLGFLAAMTAYEWGVL